MAGGLRSTFFPWVGGLAAVPPAECGFRSPLFWMWGLSAPAAAAPAADGGWRRRPGPHPSQQFVPIPRRKRLKDEDDDRPTLNTVKALYALAKKTVPLEFQVGLLADAFRLEGKRPTRGLPAQSAVDFHALQQSAEALRLIALAIQDAMRRQKQAEIQAAQYGILEAKARVLRARKRDEEALMTIILELDRESDDGW